MGILPFPFISIIHKRKPNFKKRYIYQIVRIFKENPEMIKVYVYLLHIIQYSYVGILHYS